MKVFITAFVFSFFMFVAGAQHSDTSVWCVDYERFGAFRESFPQELFDEYYPFIRYNENYIKYYHPEVTKSFYKLLQQSSQRKIRILHIGDSHIHSDIFTGYVRKRLQFIFGSAGRGLMFPYCTAGTHATRDYLTRCTGHWTSSKTTEKVLLYDIGLTGVTARTVDVNATASIILRPREYSMNRQQVLITLFYLPGDHSFQPVISSGENLWKVIESDEKAGVMKGMLDWTSDTLTISFERKDSIQNFFELYGIAAEYPEQQGLLYHSAGINGAALQHLVNQKLIEKHMAELNPDLIILDLGTNDIYKGVFNESVLYKMLIAVLYRIRQTIPEACIMLMPPQDMYYRKKHVVTTEKFSAMLHKVAIEQKCAFYDFFSISGGNLSMLQWEKSNLAKKDRIHLTNEGYELKGKLFVTAFLDAYLKFTFAFSENPQKQIFSYDPACVSLWFSDTSFYLNPVRKNELKETVSPGTTQAVAEGMQTVHIVKKGESLSLIANRYGISVARLQQLNDLSGTIIYPGQKLVVEDKNGGRSAQQSAETQSDKMPEGKTITYIIRSGETLYSIAKAHGVTVANIREWNHLTSDLIRPGQKILLHLK